MYNWLVSKAFGRIFHHVVFKNKLGFIEDVLFNCHVNNVFMVSNSSNLTFPLPYLKSVKLTFFKTLCYRDL